MVALTNPNEPPLSPVARARRLHLARARSYAQAFTAFAECGTSEAMEALREAMEDLEASALELAAAKAGR